MFIVVKRSGYNRKNEQVCHGMALILMEKEWDGIGSIPSTTVDSIRAIVRHTRYIQCGQWMVGSAQIGPERIVLCGTYGADGLTKSVPPEVWDRGLPIPKEIFDAWNRSGGNGVGDERCIIAKWALENIERLRRGH